MTPLCGNLPSAESLASQRTADLCRPVISTGAPSRGVPGLPWLPAFWLSPCGTSRERVSCRLTERERRRGERERGSETHHLVLPRAAVVLVAAVDDARLPVDLDVDVEPEVAHLHVEVRAGVVLAEVDAARVALKDLLDHVGDRARRRKGALVVERHPGVVEREAALDRVLEDVGAVRRRVDIVLDVLEHEPWRIARVVPRRAARVLQDEASQPQEQDDEEVREDEKGRRTRRFGMRPCLRTVEKARMWSRAAAY